MIPMWKFAPAIACGNAFILKPSERDPCVPMRLAELSAEGSVSACRELRLLLLECRLASDPEFEGTVSQALCLAALMASIAVGGYTAADTASHERPPGRRRTWAAGEVPSYPGSQWLV